ncbi:claudin-10 isoform X2 [Xenopus tropicalis]|nr:claudin-10 isoform X2 [Xenopus tropicalis]
MVLCVSGIGAIVVAITSNEWKVTTRASSVITATWVFQGLWMNCAGNALGSYHCRPHLTIFRVEGFLQACRALMISAVVIGFFGTVLGFLGMKCTKIGGSDQMKSKMACAAGILFILSGLCTLSGCSLYAHKTTTEFFDPSFVSQKYELGTALFVGWSGAAVCLLGGCIFCCSFAAECNRSRPGYSHAKARSLMSLRSREPKAERDPMAQGFSKDFKTNSYV